MKNKYFMDYIGGVNYIDDILDYHPVGLGGGFLLKASGWENGIQAANACAALGKVFMPWQRIHGLWEDSHIFKKKHIKKAVTQAKKVAKLADNYKNLPIWFSPWLEMHPSTDPKLFKQCAKACREVLPKRVKIVCSGLVRKRGIDEVHHGHPIAGKYIFSFDGKDMFDSNVGYWKNLHNNKRCKGFGGWFWRLNGKKDKDDDTPRHLRKCWPSPQQFKKAGKQLKG